MKTLNSHTLIVVWDLATSGKLDYLLALISNQKKTLSSKSVIKMMQCFQDISIFCSINFRLIFFKKCNGFFLKIMQCFDQDTLRIIQCFEENTFQDKDISFQKMQHFSR